jgi:glycerate 2-kinase
VSAAGFFFEKPFSSPCSPTVKLLLAPDKFKGSLPAAAVAEALARGWKSVRPETECTFAPIADGGEGFSEAFAQALGAEWITLDSVDALGRPIRARYAWVGAERTAVIEMSEASGLWRIASSERDPRRANTYGTGVLLRDAVERGARRILLGIGGSATTDGGAGMAAAMGFRFLEAGSGDVLEPLPCHFAKIGRIDASAVPDLPEIIAACDVQNPLLGPRGTAAVFSPQKGADPETVDFLEGALAHFAQVVEGGTGRESRNVPGAGAAGGIGFGLLSFCGASLEPGFELVARAMQLEQRMAAADLVFTGEGRLDAQTLDGKGPAGVAAMARGLGKPVVAFAGSIEELPAILAHFDAAVPIIDRPVSLEEAMQNAAPFLERAAARTARLLRLPFSL